MDNIELSNSLYECNKWGDIKELFILDYKKCSSKNDLIMLHNKYIPYIWLGRAFTTVIKKYTDFRGLISNIDDNNSSYALASVFLMGETKIKDKIFNKGIYYANNNKAIKKQLQKTTDDLIEIDLKIVKKFALELKSKIDNDDIVLTSNNQKKESVKAYHLLILLALCTGRRQVELLKTLEIDYNKKRKHQIYFKGIVKGGKDKEVGTILFLTVKETKHYLVLLRRLLNTKELTNTQVNQKFNGVLASALLKYSKDIINIDLKFHDLRSLYAEYAWDTLGQDYTNKAIFFDTVLNHTVMPTSADNYFKFKNKRVDTK